MRLAYAALFGLSSLYGQPIHHRGDKHDPAILSQSQLYRSGCTPVRWGRISTPLPNSWWPRAMRVGRRSIRCACSPTSAAGSSDQALTAPELNEQCVERFLHDRYQCYRGPHRDDHPILRRLLEQLREQGVIPLSVVVERRHQCVRPHRERLSALFAPSAWPGADNRTGLPRHGPAFSQRSLRRPPPQTGGAKPPRHHGLHGAADPPL